MAEKLTPRAITPMKQSFEAGCGPTSIAMVFSGFGINVSEQQLVEKYFPTAGIPIRDWDPEKGITPGLFDADIVRGIVQIIDDLGLRNSLQFDVFAPPLYRHTNSQEERYIVRANPGAAGKHGRFFDKGTELRDFFDTLEQMSKRGEISVYTANSRMMRFSNRFTHSLSREAFEGFQDELFDFIKQGHIVGPHGGMTGHIRALDGTRIERLEYQPDKEGFVMIDPADTETYAMSPNSLVWVDSTGIRGDTFDYLFRVSPRTNELRSETQGFRRLLQNLRGLTP